MRRIVVQGKQNKVRAVRVAGHVGYKRKWGQVMPCSKNGREDGEGMRKEV